MVPMLKILYSLFDFIPYTSFFYSIMIHNKSRCHIQLEVLGRSEQRQSSTVYECYSVRCQLAIFSSPRISLLGHSVLASQLSVIRTLNFSA